MKSLLGVIVAAAFAVGADAALSKDYANFPIGPAQLLLTGEEREAWKKVQTDDEAKAFVDEFWARRDPTPGTPANEFRSGFERRVAIADNNYGNARTKGSLTDRGKVFVLMGAPTTMQKSAKRSSNIQTPTTGLPADLSGINTSANRSVQAYSSKEVWIYDQGQSKLSLGQPKVELMFVDQYDSNEWKLDRLPSTDPPVVFEHVARSFVGQRMAESVERAPAAAPAFKDDTLRTIVDEIRAGKAAASPDLFVTVAEFVTPEGEQFVPVQLYVPAGSGIEPDKAVTLFGEVDRGEERVVLIEERTTLSASTGGAYVARSLALPPGEYQGVFGIRMEGKPAFVTATPIKVTGLDRDAAGASELILSNHIYTLSEAQAPTDPYTFGGMRVVPKSDRTFRTSDELWYYVELRNPGIEAATKEPKLSVKLSLTGRTTEGSAVRMVTPAEETPAQELKGVRGHWALGQSIPLESFRPGEYTLAVKVTDLVANRTFELSGAFRIVK